ncbi:MAG TPA: iron ABC transporter substrate-binding protein [Nocardioidaceae bacterium]|nr:iron ABC transporter substrate-binding protein [Nocardioidaceae bacterium]
MRSMRRRTAGLAAMALAAAALTACSDSEGAEEPSLVVYNAQHEELIDAVAASFTDATGIDVQLRNGSDLELANQLVQEGDASPADVFLTENSPAMTLVDGQDLFAPLERRTLRAIPAQYRPDDGRWTGFAARSTVLVYNTASVRPDELPDSLLELAEPQWRGRISFSPAGADFQAIVSAVLATEGEPATREWLAGLKRNGTVYDGNNVVLQSVNAGESDAGVIYHYYWYRDQEESGENSNGSKLHFFGDHDPGAFLSVSGAGVLQGSDDATDAQAFVRYLTGAEGQRVIADSYALEYTLNPRVPLGRGVKPLSGLQPPRVDVSDLNSPQVVDLMTEAGFL